MKNLCCLLIFCIPFNFAFAQDSEETRYTVYYFLGEECKICQYYTPKMKEYYNSYASDSLSFLGLFPNKYSSKSGVNEFSEKYQIPFPLKLEFFATKTKLFDIKITPEVVVYDNEQDKILYKGRIDDSYVRIGKRRSVPTQFELEDVLQKIVDGLEVTTAPGPAVGCFITLRN